MEMPKTQIDHTRKTKDSVKKNLKDTFQKTSLPPARAVSQVDSNQGGYMLAASSSDLCHNRKQVWNINHKVKNTGSSFEPLQFGKKDDLTEVMKCCKSE